jgi:hypothetical protein
MFGLRRALASIGQLFPAALGMGEIIRMQHDSRHLRR